MKAKGRKFLSVIVCVVMVATVFAVAVPKNVSAKPSNNGAGMVTLQGVLSNPPTTAIVWEQANIDGFGDRNNVGTTPTAVFEGNLYAGTTNFVTGAEVWRSSDGTTWTQMIANGFGDPTNVGACAKIVFQNMLYAGTWKLAGGGEIWRTSDGENWTQVNVDGFGDQNNVWAYPSAVFNGYLYAGTENYVTGGEVWRSSDGRTWTQVNVGGFGDPKNVWALSLSVFGGNIYVGTRDDTNGGQVWGSSNGTTWTHVSANGFGDPNNVGVYPLWICRDCLYAGTDNYVTGTEVWRSSDGTIWTQVNVDGFGDQNNFAIGGSGKPTGRNCATLNTKGTWNTVTGGELWMYSGDKNWTQVNEDGFGDRNNYVAFVEMVFDGKLYVGTGNDITGGEIWRGIIYVQPDLKFEPETINPKSKGKWVTCYIELPIIFDVNDIDISTVKISEINGNSVDIPAETHPTEVGDHDKDGIPDLMVKFDRSEVIANINPEFTSITVKGKLVDGFEFEG